MASLRQIRRRMKSIENIHEITAAMEMIAAFRFKRAENRFSKSKIYFSELRRLFSSLASSLAVIDHPLFAQRPIKRKTLVLVTADKGLCGAFNSSLIKKANIWLRENESFETSLVLLGKIGCDFFQKRPVVILSAYTEKTKADFDLAKKITEELKTYFLSQRTDQIDFLYNDFRMGGTGQSKLVPFLSLDYLRQQKNVDQKNVVDYIFEPSLELVFGETLSRFLESQVYGVMLESLTAEFNARMMAMKQATDNGEEVLDLLKILRNKTRQATITRELSEIVGGAAVLV